MSEGCEAAGSDGAVPHAGSGCRPGRSHTTAPLPDHHADRTATVEQQAQRRLADLAAGLPVRPVAAMRASRGTSRLFLVGTATAAHARYLTERLAGLEQSPWSAELLVYWPR